VKWLVRRIALKIWARRNTARWGRCFRALFGIPLGPGAFADFETPDVLNLVKVG
jgi:hypothetical protein